MAKDKDGKDVSATDKAPASDSERLALLEKRVRKLEERVEAEPR